MYGRLGCRYGPAMFGSVRIAAMSALGVSVCRNVMRWYPPWGPATGTVVVNQYGDMFTTWSSLCMSLYVDQSDSRGLLCAHAYR